MNNSSILKNETKDLHDSVERVMNSSLLFSNQFTMKHYSNFLYKSCNYITSLLNSDNDNWTEYKSILEQKQRALFQDLKSLNIEIENTKSNIEMPNKYYNLGLIYIVLGAMLGNKVILNKLKQRDEFKDSSFLYLSVNQEILPELWRSFQNKIDDLTPDQLNNVIAGAKHGYGLFGQ